MDSTGRAAIHPQNWQLWQRHPHAKLYRPLASLATLGAYPRITTTPDGTRYITLTYSRASTHKSQRKAQAIVTRFERLIILQLDVPDGHNPRTVQQLVASRRVLVVDGRYILGK